MMIDASAIEACVTLAEGDMRRVLHILQVSPHSLILRELMS